jgi:hypothetical protein
MLENPQQSSPYFESWFRDQAFKIFTAIYSFCFAFTVLSTAITFYATRALLSFVSSLKDTRRGLQFNKTAIVLHLFVLFLEVADEFC